MQSPYSPKDLFIIHLIGEELKSRKLFRLLSKIGLGYCPYQPHLDKIILQCLGLYDGSDETFARYDAIMDRRARQVKRSYKSVSKQAKKAFEELGG